MEPLRVLVTPATAWWVGPPAGLAGLGIAMDSCRVVTEERIEVFEDGWSDSGGKGGGSELVKGTNSFTFFHREQ